MLGAVGVVQLDRPVDVPRRPRGARRRACGSGRSATSSTRCRRTSAPTPSSTDLHARHRRGGDGRMSSSARLAGRAGRRAEEAGLTRRRGAPGADDRRHRPGRQRLPRAGPRPGRHRRPPPRGARLGRRRGRVPAGHRHADLHAELEAELADFLGQPSALVFSSGYPPTSPWSPRWPAATRWSSPTPTSTPPWSTPPGSPGPGSTVVPHSDVDRRRPGAPGRAATHAAAGAGRVHLLGPRRRGSAGELADLCAVRRAAGGRRGARPRRPRPRPGRAVRARRRPHVVVTATLSKSLGSQGGAVLGSAGAARAPGQPGPAVHLRHRAGAGVGGAALAALDVLRARPELSDRGPRPGARPWPPRSAW